MNFSSFVVISFCYLGNSQAFLISSPRHAKTDVVRLASQLQVSSSSSSSSSEGVNASPKAQQFQLPQRSHRIQHKDTVIIGSGLAGLSAALYLSQIDPDRHITVVDKEPHNVEDKKKTTLASFAAAGMLAPQSERLPKGPLLDISLESRRMYPGFCELVERMAKESGDEGFDYLYQGSDEDSNNSKMDRWSVGYMASGGFLAPAFAGDTVATWAPPDEGGSATWLDEIQVRELEPSLHPQVIGGWWFPEDASVDARRLTCSLHAACIAAGVQFSCGKAFEVTSLDLNDGKCHGLWLQNGQYLKAKSVLVANGAWMRNLLPVPIEPHKGQSLSLQMPKDRPPILRRVLFAQDCYIVPKADGKIVIGATVEAGSFDGNVTPAGLLHVLTHALQLVPGLQNLPVAETWAGLRPTTPDKGPILGKSPWENLFLAGGYWRNGVLLAPKTAQLLACLMTGTEMTETDQELLEAFSWDRFTVKGGGATLAANARYAASMHPIHSRVSGAGVAAAVGTELGSYSTAKAAKEERRQDFKAMFGDEDSNDAFERAAELGRRDATTFNLGVDSDKSKASIPKSKIASGPSTTFFPESIPPLFKADVDERKESSSSSTDMESVYQSIKENKAKQPVSLPEQSSAEDKPDPGFRIFHVDAETAEEREVPPYTAPGEFLESIKKDQSSTTGTAAEKSPLKATSDSDPDTSYNDKTYDGYAAIEEANAGKSREEELQAMRKARMANRLDQESIDESKIGALKMEDDNDEDDESNNSNPLYDVQSAYKKILDNKSKNGVSLPDSSDSDEARADPGFRIFHVDPETGERREVPPYTTPGEFLQSIQKKEGAEAKEDNHAEIESKPIKAINGDSNGSFETEYNEKTYVSFLFYHRQRLFFIFFTLNASFILPASFCYMSLGTMVTRQF